MLGSIALAIIYGLKVNLSVAIVGMVNHTALEFQEIKDSKNHNLTYDTDVVCVFNDTEATNSTSSAVEVSIFQYIIECYNKHQWEMHQLTFYIVNCLT